MVQLYKNSGVHGMGSNQGLGLGCKGLNPCPARNSTHNEDFRSYLTQFQSSAPTCPDSYWVLARIPPKEYPLALQSLTQTIKLDKKVLLLINKNALALGLIQVNI